MNPDTIVESFWLRRKSRLACGKQCGGEPVKVSGGKAVAALFWSGSVVPVGKEIELGNWFLGLFLGLGMKISVGKLVESTYFLTNVTQLFTSRFARFVAVTTIQLATFEKEMSYPKYPFSPACGAPCSARLLSDAKLHSSHFWNQMRVIS